MLLRILKVLDRKKYQAGVISLTTAGRIGKEIVSLGIPVYTLGMHPERFRFKEFLKLVNLLRKIKPGLVQTILYHADLIGGIATRLLRIPVIWNVHHSTLTPSTSKRTTRWVVKLCALLSRAIPEKIVFVSHISRNHHIKIGYFDKKTLVIPNGFNLKKFRPSNLEKREIRNELGIESDSKVVGFIGRYHPQKDVNNFIQASRIIANSKMKISFIMCGNGMTGENLKLIREIKKNHLENNFHLLGLREDIYRIYPSFDVLASSSSGEAFPMVIGEAMACGIPCVVTDVGDSAYIVGNTGEVVPPKDPRALAKAIFEILNLTLAEKHKLGIRVRKRIIENFDIKIITKLYEQLYESIRENKK